ncbi:MAG: sporulation protein YunB [Thermoanaerobacterales bacterium]|nr:sporulation protein YunB [Thermoanaerobacterales bacterium]
MFRYKRLYRHRKSLIIFVLIIILTLISLGFFKFFERQITPSIYAISESRARLIVTEVINKAVKEKIVKNVQYKDLISIHKNSYGQVTLIQINTIEINRLETDTTLEVVDALQDVSFEVIKITLGMASGSKILANLGPPINVHLYPVGSVRVNTTESFEEAGINQTRHRIILEIKAEIKVVMPLLSSNVVTTTDVPVAETIIIGDVPQAILDFK